MSTCLTCGQPGHGAFDCPVNTGVPLAPGYRRPPATPSSPLTSAASVVVIMVGSMFGFLLFLMLFGSH